MKFTQEMADAQNAKFDEAGRRRAAAYGEAYVKEFAPKPKPRIRQSQKPLLNKLESDYRDHLKIQGYTVREQSITLRLDPPFKSYRPDLAYWQSDFDPHSGRTTRTLIFVEYKGPHRFREKGIAKLALAAKTYPEFNFVLVERENGNWKETEIS